MASSLIFPYTHLGTSISVLGDVEGVSWLVKDWWVIIRIRNLLTEPSVY